MRGRRTAAPASNPDAPGPAHLWTCRRRTARRGEGRAGGEAGITAAAVTHHSVRAAGQLPTPGSHRTHREFDERRTAVTGDRVGCVHDEGELGAHHFLQQHGHVDAGVGDASLIAAHRRPARPKRCPDTGDGLRWSEGRTPTTDSYRPAPARFSRSSPLARSEPPVMCHPRRRSRSLYRSRPAATGRRPNGSAASGSPQFLDGISGNWGPRLRYPSCSVAALACTAPHNPKRNDKPSRGSENRIRMGRQCQQPPCPGRLCATGRGPRFLKCDHTRYLGQDRLRYLDGWCTSVLLAALGQSAASRRHGPSAVMRKHTLLPMNCS